MLSARSAVECRTMLSDGAPIPFPQRSQSSKASMSSRNTHGLSHDLGSGVARRGREPASCAMASGPAKVAFDDVPLGQVRNALMP